MSEKEEGIKFCMIKLNFKENKKVYILVILFIILFTIFLINITKNNYKNRNIGNNISNKTLDEVEEYILNVKSFRATIEVTIKSNKNTNKYVLIQVHNNNEDIQEVLEPSNIQGIKLIYKDNILKVENTQLNLETIYNNYPYVESNNLWLNSFIEEYRNSEDKTISEQNDEIIMQTKVKNDTKISDKKLFLDKKTLNPTKLLIQDNNQNEIIYILYNKIELNY